MGWYWHQVDHMQTRTLAINVSIPNLHWLACPRKHTPRVKQRVASCHASEVISIQSLPAPPPTPRGQLISQVGGGTPTMFGTKVLT